MRSVIVRHCASTRSTNKAKVHAHSTLSLSVSCSNAIYVSTNKLKPKLREKYERVAREISEDDS